MIKVLTMKETEQMEKNAQQLEISENLFEIDPKTVNAKIGDYIACEDFYADGFTIYRVVSKNVIEIFATFDNEEDFQKSIENYKNKIKIENQLRKDLQIGKVEFPTFM